MSLSLHVSVAFGKSALMMKANPVDLLEGSPSGLQRMTHDGDKAREGRAGTCYVNCIPLWLQSDDKHAIPHRHTSLVG